MTANTTTTADADGGPNSATPSVADQVAALLAEAGISQPKAQSNRAVLEAHMARVRALVTDLLGQVTTHKADAELRRQLAKGEKTQATEALKQAARLRMQLHELQHNLEVTTERRDAYLERYRAELRTTARYSEFVSKLGLVIQSLQETGCMSNIAITNVVVMPALEENSSAHSTICGRFGGSPDFTFSFDLVTSEFTLKVPGTSTVMTVPESGLGTSQLKQIGDMLRISQTETQKHTGSPNSDHGLGGAIAHSILDLMVASASSVGLGSAEEAEVIAGMPTEIREAFLGRRESRRYNTPRRNARP